MSDIIPPAKPARMTPARWAELAPLFDEALDLPAEKRRAYFDRIASRDKALATELEHLVAQGDRGDSLFDLAAAERFRLLADVDGTPVPDAGLRDRLQTSLGASYVLERELSGGGMSRVFVADELALGRKVVIKVLAPELAAGVSTDRFAREIKLAASLQQANIVPLLAAGNAGGTPYYTMPLVDGNSLRDRLAREGALPIPDVVSVLRDVARALAYAHRNGVVHRDIKPGNVLLSSGTAVVTDFGIAKALSAARADGTVPSVTGIGVSLGTPAYMSPEQITADPNTDHRTDIYALGVLAYEMLTGHPPFAGRSAQEVLGAHVTETPARVDGERPAIPPALAALVMRCLAKRAADRPQSGEEVLAALEAIASPAEVPATTTVARLAPRRTSLVIAVVIIGVVLAGFFALRRFPVDSLNPRRVVVAPFVNLTGDSTLNVLGPLIAEGVTRGLEQLDSIEVGSSTAGLLDANGRLRTLPSVDAARAIGEETRAGRVIGGTYSRDGDTLRLAAQIIDTRSGRVERALDPVVGLASASNDVIERLRDNVSTALEASAVKGTVGSIGPLPTLAAYQEFITGFELGADGPKGFPHILKAAQIDPTFTLALYWVAVRFAGEERWNEADSVVDMLRSRLDRFQPIERELFASIDAFTHSDFERDAAASRQLFKRDSTLSNADGLAIGALVINHPRETLAVLAAISPSRLSGRDWGHWNKAAIADHLLARYEAELALATLGRVRLTGRFGQSWMLDDQIRALAALGNTAALRQKVDSFTQAWNPGMRNDGWAHFHLSNDPAQADELAALELMAHGGRKEAVAYINSGLAWHAAQSATEEAKEDVQASRARLLMLAGKLDSAQAIWVKLSARDTLYAGARIQSAIVSAWRGDTTAALRTMHALDSLTSRPHAFGRPMVHKARIAAALGRKRDAVQFLQDALRLGAPYDWRWHIDPEFQSLRDFGPFVALMAPKG